MDQSACYYAQDFGHFEWWMNPTHDGQGDFPGRDFLRHLRALFDFDNRRQEREEMEKSGEDEALLAKALKGLPAFTEISFNGKGQPLISWIRKKQTKPSHSGKTQWTKASPQYRMSRQV